MINDSRPNILLIVMDTARAQTVLGNEAVMPNFHEFASEGTLFTNAFSTAPWTLPSHASIFTGQYTSDHGTHAGNKEFDPDDATLAEELQKSGYQTIGFSNNVWISSEFGFDRGFDTLRTSMQLVEGGADLGTIAKENDGIGAQAGAAIKKLFRRDGHRTLINGLYSKFLRERYDDGARVTNWRIKRWLSRHGNQKQPFFMFVNYLEPHLEYEPPEKFKYRFLPDDLNESDLNAVEQDAWGYICGQVEMDAIDFQALEALYKAELNYLDYRLGKLFNLLENRELLEETMVVVVGDHGENIGNHGLMDHQYCLYDTLLNVPLLIRYPSDFPAGEQRDNLVELRDIYPTLLESAGTDIPESHTVSAKPLQQSLQQNGREHIFAEYLVPQPSMDALQERTGELPDNIKRYDQALRSVRKKDWKLITGSNESAELYKISKDPAEQSDLSGTNEGVVDELHSMLKNRFETFGSHHNKSRQEMDPSTQERLEDLGYI